MENHNEWEVYGLTEEQWDALTEEDKQEWRDSDLDNTTVPPVENEELDPEGGDNVPA